MSFFSPTNNLRRSTRIHDASYRPRTTWRLPEIVSVASPLFFFFLGGGRGGRCDNRTDSIIFHKQRVAPSSRENAGGHASEAVEDHMDVDVNAQSMGSGMCPKSSLYTLDH
jgi:hypothetical protein